MLDKIQNSLWLKNKLPASKELTRRCLLNLIKIYHDFTSHIILHCETSHVVKIKQEVMKDHYHQYLTSYWCGPGQSKWEWVVRGRKEKGTKEGQKRNEV